MKKPDQSPKLEQRPTPSQAQWQTVVKGTYQRLSVVRAQLAVLEEKGKGKAN
jgi:hypothetical protein